MASVEKLKDRFKHWAAEVIIETRSFSKGREYDIIARQMIRSSTSSAANYRSACRAKSGRDFINKLKIVEEETDETMFWIEMLEILDKNECPDFRTLYTEANELLSITVASINTMRKKLKNQ